VPCAVCGSLAPLAVAAAAAAAVAAAAAAAAAAAVTVAAVTVAVAVAAVVVAVADRLSMCGDVRPPAVVRRRPIPRDQFYT
jgi:hypothetical protein